MSPVVLLIWYCGRCRKALRIEPFGPLKPACRCEVPQLPARPTTVHDYSQGGPA
jgi:hypothetical protein